MRNRRLGVSSRDFSKAQRETWKELHVHDASKGVSSRVFLSARNVKREKRDRDSRRIKGVSSKGIAVSAKRETGEEQSAVHNASKVSVQRCLATATLNRILRSQRDGRLRDEAVKYLLTLKSGYFPETDATHRKGQRCLIPQHRQSRSSGHGNARHANLRAAAGRFSLSS